MIFRFIVTTQSVQVISEADDEVIQSCLKLSNGQEDTDSAPSTQAPPHQPLSGQRSSREVEGLWTFAIQRGANKW